VWSTPFSFPITAHNCPDLSFYHSFHTLYRSLRKYTFVPMFRTQHYYLRYPPPKPAPNPPHTARPACSAPQSYFSHNPTSTVRGSECVTRVGVGVCGVKMLNTSHHSTHFPFISGEPYEWIVISHVTLRYQTQYIARDDTTGMGMVPLRSTGAAQGMLHLTHGSDTQ
jgi:hypothetical protein